MQFPPEAAWRRALLPNSPGLRRRSQANQPVPSESGVAGEISELLARPEELQAKCKRETCSDCKALWQCCIRCSLWLRLQLFDAELK
ncbi:hypothetical protein E2C01_050342 [Portunus trituberculatus]|uniref:Uncharacterized protein n=1 Tax=Portunus trituberculatus TaxID=210409 RepID=A0A5B7G8P9_PORTR|nr:hypothetical protein [Portunus trituberculatus]